MLDEFMHLTVANAVPMRPQLLGKYFGAPDPLFPPGQVQLTKASGGFNTVIEFAEAFCARVFELGFGSFHFEQGVVAQDLKAFLLDSTEPFNSSYLHFLQTTPRNIENHVISIDLVLTGLNLGDDESVTVTYTGSLLLVPQSGTVAPRPSAPGAPPSPSGYQQFSDPWWIGDFQWTLKSPTIVDVAPDNATVDVYADLTRAQVNTTIGGDVEQLYVRFLEAKAIGLLTHPAWHAPRVRICPSTSLVGTSFGRAVPVTEFQNFDVEAFVVKTGSRRAFALAFNLLTGCRGIIEAVEHFIGRYDYGVISDEIAVQGLMHRQWNVGGFLRSFPLEMAVKIKVNGNQEEGTLIGTFELQSLDVVSIDMDSTLRTDVVVLGGTGLGKVLKVRRANGDFLYPSDFPHDDFGSLQKPWVANTVMTFEGMESLTGDPLTLEFTRRAHDDAYQYLAHPFAPIGKDASGLPRDTLSDAYVRIDGLYRRVFCLANVQ